MPFKDAIHSATSSAWRWQSQARPVGAKPAARGSAIARDEKICVERTIVEGGKPLRQACSPAEQHRRISDMGFARSFGRPAATPPPTLYADAAVVAFRVPSGESDDAAQVKIISSGDGLNAGVLTTAT